LWERAQAQLERNSNFRPRGNSGRLQGCSMPVLERAAVDSMALEMFQARCLTPTLRRRGWRRS
jgi:hypothetical protein